MAGTCVLFWGIGDFFGKFDHFDSEHETPRFLNVSNKCATTLILVSHFIGMAFLQRMPITCYQTDQPKLELSPGESHLRNIASTQEHIGKYNSRS